MGVGADREKAGFGWVEVLAGRAGWVKVLAAAAAAAAVPGCPAQRPAPRSRSRAVGFSGHDSHSSKVKGQHPNSTRVTGLAGAWQPHAGGVLTFDDRACRARTATLPGRRRSPGVEACAPFQAES